MLKIYSTVHNTVITHLLEHREQDMQTERCLPFFCSWFELSKILESILSNEQADERAEWQGGGGRESDRCVSQGWWAVRIGKLIGQAESVFGKKKLKLKLICIPVIYNSTNFHNFICIYYLTKRIFKEIQIQLAYVLSRT